MKRCIFSNGSPMAFCLMQTTQKMCAEKFIKFFFFVGFFLFLHWAHSFSLISSFLISLPFFATHSYFLSLPFSLSSLFYEILLHFCFISPETLSYMPSKFPSDPSHFIEISIMTCIYPIYQDLLLRLQTSQIRRFSSIPTI